MLEALEVSAEMRGLEIGTGTGYNAALLSHRLGGRNVCSIDIDTDLVSTARERLARLEQPGSYGGSWAPRRGTSSG